MRIQIYRERNLIVDATLPDDKANIEILRKIALDNLKLEEAKGEMK